MRLPWLTNRSLEVSTRTSPGIMSPADKLNDVSRHQVAKRHLFSLAVADDCRRHVDHGLELRRRCVRPGFLR